MSSSTSSAPGRRSPEKISWTQRVTQTNILPINVEEIKFQLSQAPSHPYESPTFITPPDSATSKAIHEAVDKLKNSVVPIAFPTETVYGLGADATRDEAVRNIFAAKDRYTDNPLIVHVGSLCQARALMQPATVASSKSRSKPMANGHANGNPRQYEIPEQYRPLIDKFWPGPLTILLPLSADSKLSSYVYADQRTVGVRMPNHPAALALALLSGLPIAAPSANRSGLPSPTTAQHVAVDLQRRVELILDGGPCKIGVESTVVDGLTDPPVILRPGGVSLEQIRACGGIWSKVIVHKDKESETGNSNDSGVDSPRAPGMKYKHYSPTCYVRLYLPGATPPSVDDIVKSAYSRENAKVGILRSKTWNKDIGKKVPSNITIVDRWLGGDGETISRSLFAALREMDEHDVTTVHVEGIEEDGEGLAVMNRLNKAASTTIGPKN